MDNDQQVRWSFISVVRWPPGAGPSATRASQGPLPMTPIGRAMPTRRSSDVRVTHQSPAAMRTTTVDRSAKNIENWSAYLPAECVAVMVSLGWDRTA
jgi:hypothetical protein